MSERKITPRMRLRYGLQRRPRQGFVITTTSDDEAMSLEMRALDAGWSVVDDVDGKEHLMTFKPPQEGLDGV